MAEPEMGRRMDQAIAVEPLEISLPFPPTSNGIWRFAKRGGAYLSKPYKAWKAEADGMFLQQKAKVKPIKGRYEMFVVIDEKRRRGNTDVENRLKVIADALQRWGLIENDALADCVCIRWGYAPAGCFVQAWPKGRAG